MKLSEIKGERSFDVIAECIEPIVSIAQDEEVVKAIQGSAGNPKKVAKAASKILKEHRNDLIAILACINGTSADEYAENMTVASIVSDVMEILTDNVLLSFLG